MSKAKKTRNRLNKAQKSEVVRLYKAGMMSPMELVKVFDSSETVISNLLFGIREPFTEDEKEMAVDIYKSIKSGLSREDMCVKYNVSTATVDKYKLAGERLVHTPEIFEKQKNRQITIEEVSEPPQNNDDAILRSAKLECTTAEKSAGLSLNFKEKISDLIFEAACNNDFELCGLLATIGEFLVKREGENNEH